MWNYFKEQLNTILSETEHKPIILNEEKDTAKQGALLERGAWLCKQLLLLLVTKGLGALLS